MTEPETVDAAAGVLAREWRVPFTLHRIAPEGDDLHVSVQVGQGNQARSFFAVNPMLLADGRVVTIRVTEVRAEQWESWPLVLPKEVPTRVPDGLIGMNVQDAALLANATGWLVRAAEPYASVTLDLSPIRLNLCYDEHGRVTSVDIG